MSRPAAPRGAKSRARSAGGGARLLLSGAAIALALAAGPARAAAGPEAAAPAPPAWIEPLSDGGDVELPPLDPAIPSPAEFLGYPLGSRFTHHGEIMRYLDRLAASSERVSVARYGTTYEGRPLALAAISSPANLARLDEIQADLRGLAAGDVPAQEIEAAARSTPIAIWLGYGVHGNEASSAEAAMAAAWVFAAAAGPWAELLERAVILIDPLCNPDGRERYVHFYETRRGREPDPLAASAEHAEPWPGGRQNHYLVDLNRDWAWMTQRETRERLAAYRSWDPQVYVDFHEMGPSSSYFFPPAADPIHPHIDPRSLFWLETFGRANAAAFDSRGWVYYVGERFDLFYPGYGDSYPSLRGAIGMTYETAGHGTAGQVLERADGSRLTLADRIARHLTTSLATARTAIENREELLADFARSRSESLTRAPSTYLWRADQQEAAAAAELLAGHGLEVTALAAETTLRARPLLADAPESTTFPAGTYAVSTRQPLGNLARALLDLDAPMPQSFLEEQRRRIEQNRNTQFYDITAWSLPLAYNLETYVAAGHHGGAPRSGPRGVVRGRGELGYLVAPQGLAGYRLAAALQREGVGFRLTLNGFELDDRAYPDGTLFVPRRGNPESLDETLAALAASTGVAVDRVASGYSEKGISLGSDSAVAIRSPRVGLLSGDGVNATSFGFLWHLLDRQVRVSHHRLELRSLPKIDLGDFDVLVLPSGAYGEAVSDEGAEKLESWVRAGGVLIAVGKAGAWLRERELSEIKAWQPPQPSTEDNAVTRLTPSNRELHTPGAALATRIQRPHPLTAGVAGSPAALYSGRTVLLATGNPRQDVVLAAESNPVVAGFAWPEAQERLSGSLLVGLEPKGRGALVVFSQEPAFRLFWRGTAPVFLNAVLYGTSLLESGQLR